MTATLTILGITAAAFTLWRGIAHLREHNQFMRDLEAKQRLRREKAEKLKGIKL